MSILLDLDKLAEGLPGVTKVTGAYLREASIAALLKNGHQSGKYIKVEGLFNQNVCLTWEESDENEIVKSWKNDREAASYGAVGIALLLVHHFSEYKTFELSDLGTGIDYWMSQEKTERASTDLLEEGCKARNFWDF